MEALKLGEMIWDLSPPEAKTKNLLGSSVRVEPTSPPLAPGPIALGGPHSAVSAGHRFLTSGNLPLLSYGPAEPEFVKGTLREETFLSRQSPAKIPVSPLRARD